MNFQPRWVFGAVLAALCITVGCYDKSAFICSDGDETENSICANGVFIPKGDAPDVSEDMVPTQDVGANNCQPEGDDAFCARLGKNCEDVTAQDNCGQFRTTDCGSCDADGLTCGGGGTTNVCGCPTLTDEEVCAGATCGSVTAVCEGETFDVMCGMCGANSTCDAAATPMMCVCDAGYEPAANGCGDVDECATNTDTCDPVAEICVNEPGTFRCDCAPKYMLVNGNCVGDRIVVKTERVNVGMQAALTASADISGMFADTSNVVPFISASFVNGGGEADRLAIDVRVDATEVVVSRDDQSGGDAFVAIELAQFDPAKVRVQSGTLDIQSGDNSDVVTLGQVVDPARAFVVFYGLATTSSDHRSNVMVAATLSNDEIEFSRDNNNGSFIGHYWVVEALNDEFSVQHISEGPMQVMQSTYAIPNAVAKTDSFLLYSYETNTSESASRGHVVCSFLDLQLQNDFQNIDCRRLSENDEIRDLRFQVVTLGTGSVSRGTTLVGNATAAVPLLSDLTYTTLLVGHIGAAGACNSDRNGSLLWQGMVRGELTATQILLYRGSDLGSSAIAWEAIAW